MQRMQRKKAWLLLAVLLALPFILGTLCSDCRGEGCDGCSDGYEVSCGTVTDLDTGEKIKFCRCIYVGSEEGSNNDVHKDVLGTMAVIYGPTWVRTFTVDVARRNYQPGS